MKVRCVVDIEMETGEYKITFSKLEKSKKKIDYTKFVTMVYKALMEWQDKRRKPAEKVVH